MTIELLILAWTLVLALVQIFLPVVAATRDHGLTWNMGPRDEPVGPPSKIGGRLARARANLFETLPVFAAAVLIAHAAGREGDLTHWGAEIYLIARIVYVLIYALGIPVVRTLVWAVSVAGLIMALIPILHT